MLSTLLITYSALVPLVALVLLALLIGIGVVLQRGRRRRAAGALAVLAVVAALLLTLTPDTAAPGAFCRVGFAWPTVLGVEAFANLLLLLPATFLGAIATRRPIAVAAAGAGLSAAVELVQALLPALGRACDTQDWEMNTIGALAGAALGWWIGRLAAGSPGPVRWAVTAVAATALVAWLVVPVIVPPSRTPDPSDEPAAGAATRLQGDVRVTAGSAGGLCFTSPSGTTSITAEDVEPGPVSTDDEWQIGVELAGTRTARDGAGRPVRLQPVAGSDLLVWSAPAG